MSGAPPTPDPADRPAEGDPYRPIDCGFHDRLLALATLRRECEIVFRDERGVERRTRARIADVYTRAAAEHARLDDGTVIRLDRLVSVDGVHLSPPDR